MINMEHVPVVILAGGKGTRLKKVVFDRPKVLAEIHGRPFLYYLLDDLDRQGACRVILCTSFMGELVRQDIGERYKNLRIEYSHETVPLGTGGAILNALPIIDADSFIVMNGDSFSRFSLSEFFNFALGHGTAMMLSFVEDTARYGFIRINSEGRILAFQEKQSSGPGLVNSGIYWINTNALGETGLDPGEISLENEILPRLIDQGLYGYVNKGPFIDIGTESSYLAAASFFHSTERWF